MRMVTFLVTPMLCRSSPKTTSVSCRPSRPSTNPVASELKAEFAKHIADIAAPQDDPVYIELPGFTWETYSTISKHGAMRNCFASSLCNLSVATPLDVSAVGGYLQARGSRSSHWTFSRTQRCTSPRIQRYSHARFAGVLPCGITQ
jgi:hypothetical protein